MAVTDIADDHMASLQVFFENIVVAPTSNNVYGKDQFNLEGRGLLEGDTGGAQIIKNGLPWQPVSKY